MRQFVCPFLFLKQSVCVSMSNLELGAKSLDELRDRLREKIEVLQKNRIGEEATKKKRTSQKRENSKKEAAPDKRPKVEEAKSTPISDTDTESVLSLTPSVDDVITKYVCSTTSM